MTSSFVPSETILSTCVLLSGIHCHQELKAVIFIYSTLKKMEGPVIHQKHPVDITTIINIITITLTPLMDTLSLIVKIKFLEVPVQAVSVTLC